MRLKKKDRETRVFSYRENTEGVFKTKSREKTRQDRGKYSQQLVYKQVPQMGTEQGVREGKRFLMACHTSCK